MAGSNVAQGSYVVYFYTSTMGTTVAHRLECDPLDGGLGTQVRQAVFIAAPWLLRGYVVSTARKAHEESLEALPRVIGN